MISYLLNWATPYSACTFTLGTITHCYFYWPICFHLETRIFSHTELSLLRLQSPVTQRSAWTPWGAHELLVRRISPSAQLGLSSVGPGRQDSLIIRAENNGRVCRTHPSSLSHTERQVMTIPGVHGWSVNCARCPLPSFPTPPLRWVLRRGR